ncbi:MAG: ubiquinol-cytochrome c reductase iron-sulfur subunit [Candidatus Methanofastidiosia archaeon]
MRDIEKVSRRSFLNIALGAAFALSALFAGIPILAYLWPSSKEGVSTGLVEIATTQELSIWEAKTFVLNGKAAILVRVSEDGYKAFFSKCTHAGCTVKWLSTEQVFKCPCHDGFFDSNGKNIKGPPPSPLGQVNLIVEGGKIFAGG